MSELRKAKRKYEHSRIEQSSKGVWSVLRRRDREGPLAIKSGGHLLGGEAAAERLRDCFKEKIDRLKREPKPEKIQELFREHLRSNDPWKLETVTLYDLSRIIDGLKPKRSCGKDGISYLLVKQYKQEIMQILLTIVNRSLQEKTFFTAWKLGRVVPIYKQKGDRTDPSSYRPVTLTSVVGRIVEMVV